MFKKDGITYESEQEYQYARQNNVIDPKKHLTGEIIWRVIAVVCLLIVLFFIISACSEGSPP